MIIKHGIQSESTEISIELYSVPQYDSFNWKTLTCPITNISSKYDTAVTGPHFKTVLYGGASFQVAVWKFSLVIYDLNREDFNIYILQVANKVGNTSCRVRLEPSSKYLFNNLGAATFKIVFLTFSHCHIKTLEYSLKAAFIHTL